jgi:hypothetical protein
MGIVRGPKSASRMPVNKLLLLLNRLLSLFKLGLNIPGDFLSAGPGRRVFGIGTDHPLRLEGDAVLAFDSALGELLEMIPTLSATMSRRELCDRLIPLIREKKVSDLHFTADDANVFVECLSATPIQKMRIIRRLHGASLPDDFDQVRLGMFTIYPQSVLTRMMGTRRIFAIERDKPEEHPLYIECTVEVRDWIKAEELTDALFIKFELIMRFLSGRRTKRFELGVLNYVGPQMRDRIILSADGQMLTEGSAWQGAVERVSLMDSFFTAPSPHVVRLLGLIGTENSDLEEHVLRCAEWTGQAMGDPSPASAFVKAAIALEVLFSGNDKGPITPSVMSQIAESCALIHGKSIENAIELERLVKQLYGVRSAIVHSGRDFVPVIDLNTLIQICCETVIVLLIEQPYKEMKSMAEVVKHLKQKRYASAKV